MVSVVTLSPIYPQIGTSFNSPGCIPSRTARISSILSRTLGHLLESRTTMAIRVRLRFCWYRMF